MECDKMPLVLKGELQDLTFVKNNELVIDEELLLEEKQIEKQHLELIMENVLIRVEDLYFPIESLTFGMEDDRKISLVEKPSVATVKCGLMLKMGK